MDLSVVILNWKVKELLRKCLQSVFEHTSGLEFEVIVADNDSGDGSVEMLRRDFPRVRVIENPGNLGFAAGNNPGLDVARGDFVLLLNPDTELKDNALARMVEVMRRDSGLGVLGPHLLNADGSHQESVRGFPRLSNQALVALKLHRLLPRSGPMRRYLCDGFDYSKASDVDQVMGAVFLIRREVLEKVGLLDEDYFIWFEEVDYCRRVRQAGWRVGYTPEVEVIHHGGESFAQQFGLVKQRFWNASARTYMRKHVGWGAWLVLTLLHPVSMALAWSVQTFSVGLAGSGASAPRSRLDFARRGGWLFALMFFGLLSLELLSWIGYNVPVVNQVVFGLLVAATVLLTWIRPGFGLLAVLVELVVGSQGGYGFAVGPSNVEGAILSLRMGLFLSVFGVWLARTLIWLAGQVRRKGTVDWRPVWLREMQGYGLLWPYLALLLVLALSFLRGLVAGNGFGNVFFDANGYAFLALFSAFLDGWRDLKGKLSVLWSVLAAALSVSVLKALAVLYFFSHRLYQSASNMYLWVRDTRVGEVTLMSADFHRVFFQAHLFFLVSIFVLWLLAAAAPRFLRGRSFWLPLLLLAWGGAGLLLGLSRSFWFGGFVGVVAAVFLLIRAGAGKGLVRRLLVVPLMGVLLSVVVVAGVYSVPWPNGTGDVSFSSLLGGRAMSIAGEAAANSRWSLLPELWRAGLRHPFLGSGLGTEVTYITYDERLLVDNPTGRYTTYAFEWGYHDLWIKLGLVGLVVYAWLVAAIVRPFLLALRRSAGRERLVLIGVLSGLAALLATHLFSPYLNHPLGLGLLMALAAWGVGLGWVNTAAEK